MTSLTITNLDHKTTNQISRRANKHGRSMEDEARVLLQQALEIAEDKQSQEAMANRERGNLASRIRARFEPIGGVELELPAREPSREPPSFD
ncbi:FitA-like ribbon-helix-helix domain-containing protein [Jiella sonneratiae]|uniref:Plasmid stabilization protein n=1 Tax=Jiella sonneratiae TaxID=2816856 RepID=A0ABS3J606_9HYPH|nr:plasmid stabilization protein [Jiella sonneratiae]MBO0904388.1 plasmid stabilization protein [Jiella sonneratiae]